MGLMIAAFCAVSAIGSFWNVWKTPVRLIVFFPIIMACISGLPVELYRSIRGHHAESAKIQTFVRENVRPTDQLFIDAPVYYSTVNYAAETYYFNYSGGRGLRIMPENQRTNVNVLVIYPAQLTNCVEKLKGEWVAIGSLNLDYDSSKQKLTVYRRQ
jgi:hypothetical protein